MKPQNSVRTFLVASPRKSSVLDHYFHAIPFVTSPLYVQKKLESLVIIILYHGSNPHFILCSTSLTPPCETDDSQDHFYAYTEFLSIRTESLVDTSGLLMLSSFTFFKHKDIILMA